MDFNINGLNNVKDLFDDEGEKLKFQYIDDLIALYRESEEGETANEQGCTAGDWIDPFLTYYFGYTGKTFPSITVADTEELITNIFPRKVSLQDKSEASEIILDIIYFFKFLKKQFGLENAQKIIEYLESIKKDFPVIMNDESKFGMAKSIFTMGNQMGFDMTSKEGMNEFMIHYNNGLATGNSGFQENDREVPEYDTPAKSQFTKKKTKRKKVVKARAPKKKKKKKK